MPVVQLVEIYFSAECVPVNSQQARGSRLIAPRPVQNPLDEFLFKFVDRLIKMNATFHHLSDQCFQLIFQDARSARWYLQL